MNAFPYLRSGCAVVLAVACMTGAAWAESVKLELKTLSDQNRSYSSGEFLFRMTQAQRWVQQRDDADGIKRQAAEFAEVIKKQPEKYLCEYPFRGVARLGSQKFGFVLDSTKLQRGYDRLYFDLNGNGDLTDDKVIEANKNRGSGFGNDYAECEFPRTAVTIDVEGKKLEYAFFFSVYAYGFEESKPPRYIGPSLSTAVYRDGKVTLDGKEHRIVLLDYNSTGRFNDPYHVDKNAVAYDGKLYATEGDMILVDPDLKVTGYYGYSLTDRKERVAVSKLVFIGDKYYEMKVTPTGDELTLTPYKGAMAKAVNANCDRYEAVVFGENGVLKISGERNKPVLLPVGEWQVLSYRADAVRQPATKPAAQAAKADDKKAKPAEEKKSKPNSALARSVRAWLSGDEGDDDAGADESDAPAFLRPRDTMVSAQSTKDSPSFKVQEDRTAFMKFGPPFRPTVKAGNGREERDVYLSLAIVGSGGEVLDNLMVDGSRPKAPAFQIVAPSGDIVLRGKFEFG